MPLMRVEVRANSMQTLPSKSVTRLKWGRSRRRDHLTPENADSLDVPTSRTSSFCRCLGLSFQIISQANRICITARKQIEIHTAKTQTTYHKRHSLKPRKCFPLCAKQSCGEPSVKWKKTLLDAIIVSSECKPLNQHGLS